LERREFLRRASGGALGLAITQAKAVEAMGMVASKPNLLYVFPDQYRRAAMGFTGQDPVLTPNLDRFAQESLVLPHAVSNYPVCSPFRAMLMTGKYPAQNGVLANCQSERTQYGNYLKASDTCLTDVLSAGGYDVGYIGKWHLDGPEPTPEGEKAEWDAYTPPGPRRHGVGFWYSYGTFNDHFHPHYWTGDRGEDDLLEIDQWSPEHEADVAIRFMENADGRQRDPAKPFALLMGMNPPHSPYHLVPERYRALYAGERPEDLLSRPNVDLSTEVGQHAMRSVADYFASVTGVDDQFGRLVACLEHTGLADNTIVVFTADHGEMMGSHSLMAKNVWYEESLGIPFLIRWPRRIPSRQDDLLLSVPDHMPTLLGLMGLGSSAPADVMGSDYSRAFLGGNADRPRAAPYFRIPPGRAAGGIRGLRTHQYAYVELGKRRGTELYDLRADPYQLTSLSESQPALVQRLAGEMREVLGRIGDPWRG